MPLHPQGAHMSCIDGRSVLVDYNRQQLMPGWIPRRLGELVAVHV